VYHTCNIYLQFVRIIQTKVIYTPSVLETEGMYITIAVFQDLSMLTFLRPLHIVTNWQPWRWDR